MSRWSKSLDELVAEIVDDLYLAHFGQEREDPVLSYRDALRIGPRGGQQPVDRAAAARPRPGFAGRGPRRTSRKTFWPNWTRASAAGASSATTIYSAGWPTRWTPHDSPARVRMRQRWPIVMVDEFQDTDPVQWQVIDRAFSGRSTLILIGDPKQAIYAFRGGDIVTYLHAAKTAGDKRTLATNWRSDSALVDRLQVVLRGAELGDPAIVVRDVEAHHRVTGWPVRRTTIRSGCGWYSRETFGPQRNPESADRRAARAHRSRPRRRHRRAAGQRCDVRRGPLQARDIAVIVEKPRTPGPASGRW